MTVRIPLILMMLFLLTSIAMFGCDEDKNDDNEENDDSDDDATSDDDNDTTTDDDDSSEGDFVATLEDNPVCAISCVITWTTQEPASSWIEFGESGKGYSQKIGTDDLSTDHEVIVVGMHTKKSYSLLAVSETESKQRLESQELSFAAGDIPEHWMEAEVDVYDKSQVQDGWTITNLAVGTMSSKLTIGIYDMSGELVWYYIYPGDNARIDNEVHFVDGKNICIGPAVAKGDHPFKIDLVGNVVWEGPEQAGAGMNDNGSMHHVFHQIGNGDFVTTTNDIRTGIIGDEMRQIDEDLDVVWSWNFWDHLVPEVAMGAWTHVNSIFMDLENQVAYVSTYYLALVFKIDLSNDDILWTFGLDGDFTLNGAGPYPWFTGSHGLDYLGDGKLLMYDNGNLGREYSRAIIYQVNESTMEASIIWEYSGDDVSDQWYNMSIGDADYLENGNVLITAGNGVQNQSPSRFIEVTPSGEKVWQLWLYNETDKRVSSFQCDRISSLTEPLSGE